MNVFFFLPPFILKLPGFVLFYSAERVEASSWPLSISNVLVLSLVLLAVCELWLPSDRSQFNGISFQYSYKFFHLLSRSSLLLWELTIFHQDKVKRHT